MSATKRSWTSAALCSNIFHTGDGSSSVFSFLSAVGIIYLKRQNNIYENNVIVLLKDENTATEEMLLLQDLGMSAGKNNIENEIALFRRRTLSPKP